MVLAWRRQHPQNTPSSQIKESSQLTDTQIITPTAAPPKPLPQARAERLQAAGTQTPPISVLEYTGGFFDAETQQLRLLPQGAVANTYLPSGFSEELGRNAGGLTAITPKTNSGLKKTATTASPQGEKENPKVEPQNITGDRMANSPAVTNPDSTVAAQLTAMPPISVPPSPSGKAAQEQLLETLTALPPILVDPPVEDEETERGSRRLLHITLGLTGMVVILAGAAMVAGLTMFTNQVSTPEQSEKQPKNTTSTPAHPRKERREVTNRKVEEPAEETAPNNSNQSFPTNPEDQEYSNQVAPQNSDRHWKPNRKSNTDNQDTTNSPHPGKNPHPNTNSNSNSPGNNAPDSGSNNGKPVPSGNHSEPTESEPKHSDSTDSAPKDDHSSSRHDQR